MAFANIGGTDVIDQLYDLTADPDETHNVANDTANRQRLGTMKRMLKRELERFSQRPFGEFVPGGNAVPGNEQTDLAPLLKKFAAKMK